MDDNKEIEFDEEEYKRQQEDASLANILYEYLQANPDSKILLVSKIRGSNEYMAGTFEIDKALDKEEK